MVNAIIIAGTADAREIIERLIQNKIRLVATVATDFGGQLLKGYMGVEVHKGRLTCDGMLSLISSTGAKCIVDASHPFAREVSLNAIKAARKAQIPYLRFEREKTRQYGKNVIKVEDFEEAAKRAADFKGNIFLAVGSKNIATFTDKVPDYKKRLYARVLSDSSILAECEAAGLSASNIIAAKGPFSEEMNIAMLKHCCASVLVTKDSGDAGGTPEKISACCKLGIPVILVKRPEIDYANKVSTIEEVVSWIRLYGA